MTIHSAAKVLFYYNSSCFQQVAFQGTVVTIENFLAWKAKFELEMAELRRKRQKEEEQAGKPKLTGTRCYSKTPKTVKMMTYVS